MGKRSIFLELTESAAEMYAWIRLSFSILPGYQFSIFEDLQSVVVAEGLFDNKLECLLDECARLFFTMMSNCQSRVILD
jgi:hypothetical protein